MEQMDTADTGLWGKSRGLPRAYPLVWHLVDATAVAAVLWERYVPAGVCRLVADGLGVDAEHAGRLVAFWAGLHDVGKVMACFQEQDKQAFGRLAGYPQVPAPPVGHAYAAQVWLGQALAGLGYDAQRRTAPAFRVAQLLGGHHGWFSELLDGRVCLWPAHKVIPALGEGRWEAQRQAMLRAVYGLVGQPPPPRALPAEVAAVVCGLVILADWLVSQEAFLSDRLQVVPSAASQAELRRYYELTRAAAPGLLEAAGLNRVALRPGTFTEAFPYLEAPNDLQRSVAEQLPKLLERPGLLLVMAPTGEGKTEAALHSARLLGEVAGMSGVFVGLPTMATANQMHDRVGRYVARRAVTPAVPALLHSMAWLGVPVVPKMPDGAVLTHEEGPDQEASQATLPSAPSEWLQGRKRGLLACMAVGTVDQALLAVLRGKHNVLRLLGLAGKVLVVDEVHAYDAYMQGLLRVLLGWLGRFGVPVVLLSATLPAKVAGRLVHAYLAGAGHRIPLPVRVAYPGWVYADAGTGGVTVVPVRSEERALAVELRAVPLGRDSRPARAGVLRELLAPLVGGGGGCAAVVCNTVAEAQGTFLALRAWWQELAAAGGGLPELVLLHARFPQHRRDALVAELVARFGKEGDRARPAVVVATQLVEQSLDVDFDLVVSDLAPVALLLQRAGRCHRHARTWRPGWAANPRLVVLCPVGTAGALAIPPSWPVVYQRALLLRTYQLLQARGGRPVRVPQDVQEMVEAVYDEAFAEGATDHDLELVADEQVKESLAAMAAIPLPGTFSSLHDLTSAELDEELLATRLGADSVRVLCCYTDQAGQRWLDPSCRTPLPVRGSGPEGRFTRKDIQQVLAETVPVPATWVRHATAEHAPPSAWQRVPYLRDLVLLPHRLGPAGPEPAWLGERALLLDPELGLTTLTAVGGTR